MELQVEGIYTAEPRFEAKAKALKLKQEMAAAAEEGRKRLRGMPGLDLVETPKRLEWQIRTEVEARVPEEVWKQKTTRVFEKPEIYDRTVTPSSIAGLGEAASVARLRGAMANLAYNQNKLRQLADEPLTTTGGAALSPTLGNLDRWLDQPRQRERYETQRLVQRLMQKLPTLDYLSWADRGMPRPETYTKENLTDYVPRIEQLANYPGRPTKEMKREEKEILGTAYMPEGLGNGVSIWNFEPYKQAKNSGNKEAERQWEKNYYGLVSQGFPRSYAMSQGFLNGSAALPVAETIAAISKSDDFLNSLQAYQEQGSRASARYPGWNQAGAVMGEAVKYLALRKAIGALVGAAGAAGPFVPFLTAGLIFSASRALQESGDLATGRITLPEYLNHLSKAEKQGMFAQALGELFAAGYYGAHYGGHGMGNGVPQLPGGTGASTGTSLMPQTGAPSNSLINIRNRDIVAIAGALQERGVGARDAILTAIDLAEIKRKAGENALTMTEKAFDEAFEKGFNYDIMEEIRETYSDELKEELKSGRAREESKEEFIQRANAEGYTTYEGKKGTYGFRRAGDLRWGDRATARYYYEAQREFRELGLDITFIDGEVWWNNNGITHYKIIPEAAALDHSMVVINKNATIKPREMAGHEAFHCWKNDDCRENFIDVVTDNLIFTSEEFLNFQGPIAAAYLKDEVDVTDDSQMDAFYEELFAYFGGRIHAGIYDAELCPMFRNYGAVKAAWYELIRKNR